VELDALDELDELDEIDELDALDELDELDEIDELDELDEIGSCNLCNSGNSCRLTWWSKVTMLGWKSIGTPLVTERAHNNNKHGTSFILDGLVMY
jgi:hypothetical protein